MFNKKNKEYKPNLNYSYMKEIESELPEKQKRLEELRSDIESKRKKYNSIGLLAYEDDDRVIGYFDAWDLRSWEKYKKSMYERYIYKGNTCKFMQPSIVNTISIIYIVTQLSLLAFILINKAYNKLGIEWYTFTLLWLICFEILSGVVSIWYYIIRPNLYLRKIKQKEIKKLTLEYKTLSTEIETKQGLIEAYKLATINVNKAMADSKVPIVGQLRQIIDDTRENTLDKLEPNLKSKYSECLDKCDKILDIGEEDGRIITEINRIYNVYINEINGIIERAELDSDTTRMVYELLDSFNTFLDKKIQKFSKRNKENVIDDISALKKALQDED